MVFPLTLIVDKNFKSFRGSCLLCENVLCQFVLKTVLGELIVDTQNKQHSSVHIYTCASSRSIHIWRGGAKRKSCQIKKLPEDEVATLINMSP